MLTVELYAKIRRAVLIDGLSRRDAAPVHEQMEARDERGLALRAAQRHSAPVASTRAARLFSLNPTGTLLRRPLAHFVSAVDRCLKRSLQICKIPC